MAINRIFWSLGSNQDIHLLRGQTSRDLTQTDLWLVDSELATVAASAMPGAVRFTPLFKGTEAAGIYSGFGIHVNTSTGAVTVDLVRPPLVKNNFIMEVTAGGFAEVIRVQIHTSVQKVWLTPGQLTVRPTGVSLAENTNYRFSVRAQFDDGVVGDLTDHHGVTWSPVENANTNGKLKIDAGNIPGANIKIIAKLPPSLGAAVTKEAILNIGLPWASEPAPPKVSPVAGGGWPGTISPEQVPNVLILGDGFKAGDQAAFERIANTFVHYLKQNQFTRPFDVLAASINFWKTFVPSGTAGISVRSEIYTFVEDGKSFARPLPMAAPPVAGRDWTIENLIYAAGLPIPGEENQSNSSLKSEWAQLLKTDPAPNISGDLIDQWKYCAKRSFIEERDGFPALSYGELPAANTERGFYALNLHSERAGLAGLKPFYQRLASDAGVKLPGGAEVGQLWVKKDAAFNFDNTGLVLIVSSFPGGRAVNGSGYIALSAENGDVNIPIKPAASGLNAYSIDAATISSEVSADRCRTVAHELGHSFGLGDEYAELKANFPNNEIALARHSNLQTEGDARVAGRLNSAQIKWNWQRIRKAAVVSGPITAAGSHFLIPVQRGGLQFKPGDKVLLRLRRFGEFLGKASTVLANTLPPGKELQIAGPPASNMVAVEAVPGNTVTLGDLTAYAPGSLLFAPAPAPASASPLKYANMVAKNIEDLINTDRPLTPFPCVFNAAATQTPILTGVSLPGLCFKHKPRIVGLYSGGDAYGCGIYHPTGCCIMRSHYDDESEFCAVCRYIMVDLIDPYHHEEIDRDYDEVYPLR